MSEEKKNVYVELEEKEGESKERRLAAYAERMEKIREK